MADNRIQVYAPPALHDTLTKLAEQRQASVSAVVVSLLDQALSGQSGSSSPELLARLDGLAARLDAIGATEPEAVEGDAEPSELAAFLADFRSELRAIGAGVLLTQHLADRALYVASAAYLSSRNILARTVGDAMTELSPKLRTATEDLYAAQVEKARAVAFGEGENDNA